MTRTLVTNARIVTMDPARPLAEWMLVADAGILALGTGAPPEADRTIDARGHVVLPGFQDAHIHLLSGGTDLATAAYLYDVTTHDDFARLLSDHAGRKPHLPIVIGSGWQAGIFGDDNLDRTFLDRIVPDRPAIVYDSSYHNACLNSRALDMAGIGNDSPDPPNGHIVRDATGRATGMLHEEAIGWAAERLPQLSDDDLLDGLRAGQAHANAHGITGVLDPRITETEARIYARAEAAGLLTLRVAGAALVTEADGPTSAVARLTALRQAHPGPDFHVQSAKFFMDGVFENRTAALLAPYADAHGGNAAPMFGHDQTLALFTALDAARFAIHVHVIGDLAARRAIEGLEAARRQNGDWPAAHQITHLQLVDPGDFSRLAPAGAMANIQPLWARFDPVIPDIALDMIGPEREPFTYAFRRMLDAGADWCLSSDWPVTTLNPFPIIETAVTRRPGATEGQRPPFHPRECLTVTEAVLGYTSHAARACWRAGHTGMLRPGFSADFIIIDRDIFACPPQEISATRVLSTYFKGREVWRDPAY
ncbi:MAG: hypothetical protein RLZZ528_1408 [Pseudomonadota bacterium]|jgi:predicted amidohydrolase YtcJ